MKRNKKEIYFVHCEHTQCPTKTFANGGVKQPMCHPLEQPIWMLHLVICYMTCMLHHKFVKTRLQNAKIQV